MAIRIVNVDIPSDKHLVIGLTSIYGIGRVQSEKICNILGISSNKKVKDLNEDEIEKLRFLIDKEYVVEGDLRKNVALNIKRKKDIKCYQGLRHMNNLPVRGQNTHSNARTRKVRGSSIAGKKKVSKK